MLKWFYLISTALLGLLGCATTANTNTQPAPRQLAAFASEAEKETIGWVEDACLVIKNATLQPKQTIWWVSADEPKPAQTTTIEKRTNDPQVCPALLPERAVVNRKGGTYFYELAEVVDPGMGIAFVEQSASEQYQVAYCVTSEGMSLRAKPKNGGQLQDWRAYYYLGYDVESTCVE